MHLRDILNADISEEQRELLRDEALRLEAELRTMLYEQIEELNGVVAQPHDKRVGMLRQLIVRVTGQAPRRMPIADRDVRVNGSIW